MDISEALFTDLAHFGDVLIGQGGDIATVSGLDNLKNALFHRLMTVPGSLVHRPTYGVGISLYQNAPNSFALQSKLAALIEEQFLQDPRISQVSNVSIQGDATNPQIVNISISVIPVGFTDEIRFTFKPFSEGLGA